MPARTNSSLPSALDAEDDWLTSDMPPLEPAIMPTHATPNPPATPRRVNGDGSLLDYISRSQQDVTALQPVYELQGRSAPTPPIHHELANTDATRVVHDTTQVFTFRTMTTLVSDVRAVFVAALTHHYRFIYQSLCSPLHRCKQARPPW